MNESKMVVGVAWYRPEQYSLLRALAVDADSMDNTFEEWQTNANKTMAELKRNGLVTRRVDVDVKELVAWCHRRGRPLDGAARSAYAAEHVR